MFKPKIYKSNGLEAYHLISDDGGSFQYEGNIEYSEAELFKDDGGKAYYLVTTDIGSPSKYYVEVEPEGKPIPASSKDKAISGLMRTTPEERSRTTPEDRSPEIARHEPAHEADPEPIAATEPVVMPMTLAKADPKALKETCFETPEKPAEEQKSEKPADKTPSAEEAQAAVKAMASLGGHKRPKKSVLPLVLVLLILALIVAGTGVMIYRPGLVSGLDLPFINHATPTPQPTIMPTTVPTVTPEPTPAPTATALPGGGDIYHNLNVVYLALNASDPAVTGFVANNTDKTGTSYGNLSKVCDLFDAVNEKWSVTYDNGTPQNVSQSARTLKGSPMDYSILMASLVEAQGMDSRVVVMYNDVTKAYIYYPEVKIASNDMDNYDAKAYLRGRYNITDPCIHNDGIIHWMSLSQNKTPGGYVDRLYALTVNSNNEISGV